MSRNGIPAALLLCLATCLAACLAVAAEGPGPHRLGRPADPAAIAAWDIDVRADGAGLPPGRGSVAEGRALFASRCAGCHGAAGEGGAADRLVGGRGTLASAKPVRTVGSYWPYATTLFDYVRRAMPFDAPQSLANPEVYAVSAYLLHLNGILPADAVLDAESLPRVAMPNRDGFVPDARPDVPPAP
ncbi:c-type cytochrome [Methylobacterium sp. JK268]